MSVTSMQLLQGISRSVRAIAAEVDQASHIALLTSAGTALNELMLREDSNFYLAFYQQGRQLLAEGLALFPAAGDTVSAEEMAELPEMLDTLLGYDSIAEITQKLVASLNSLVNALGAGVDANHAAFLQRVISWEFSLYQHRAQPVATAGTDSAPLAVTDKTKVLDYFKGKFPDWKNLEITSFNVLSGGFSKVTVLIESRDDINGDQSFVIRAEQPLKLLHYEASDIRVEFAIVKLMNESGLPVPEALWLEEDVSRLDCRFLVSRKAEGINYGTAVSADRPLSAELMSDVMDVLVNIHSIPIDPDNEWVQASNLARWLPCETLTDAYRAEIENIYGFIEKTGVLMTPLLMRLFNWLRDNLPQCKDPPILIHHDYGLHNMLFDGDRVTAVLDWEACHLGDPADDLQWFASNLRGRHTEAEILAAYADAGGKEVSQYRLRYREVLRAVAVIIVCETAIKLFADNPSANPSLAMLGLKFLYPAISQINATIEAAEACKGEDSG